MNNPTVIAECKEPWIYWWRLSTPAEWIARRSIYFPGKGLTGTLTGDELKVMWEGEGGKSLMEEEWLQLAERILKGFNYPLNQKEEIWRQVYRIASDKI